MAIKYFDTRIKINFAVCGLVLLIIGVASKQLSSKEVKERWDRHIHTIRQFPCGLPQPRSISVYELLENKLETSEDAAPHTTVLHRCDAGTGCCSEKSKVCKVAEMEEIELHFYVTDSIRKRKPAFREYTVTNHTRCSCQTITNDIK